MSIEQALAFHTEAFRAVALWTGLSLLFILWLSMRISAGRRKLKVSVGDGGHPALTASTRAFGNAIEYVPLALVALAVVAVFYSAAIVHAVGGAFFIGRVLHAWGMGQEKQPAVGRMLGMILTYLTFIGSAGLLIFAAVF
ncbi:MAPEG family protein [Brevundimonas sp. M20]|uniref:MAPEG family protein n=1 Tax=Brevundimonas sp. M20 TaxID=2591463 RepID=UPI00114780E8|nr:MAPEG family protein [Brevundimonas sp. M20]QDH72785.1 glutathione S-transferase [Brevundimonas sp. M20]